MRRRLAALLVAVLAAGTVSAVTGAAAAHAAAPSIVWSVNYGAAITNNSPNVWSNRSPTWVVGSNPQLTFTPHGNLMDFASFCPGNLCWQSNTSDRGPGPWQAWWDSRYNIASGDFRIYSSDGVVRFHTGTSGWNTAKMALFSNGCLNIYGGDYGSWGVPIWSNSASSACFISLG